MRHRHIGFSVSVDETCFGRNGRSAPGLSRSREPVACEIEPREKDDITIYSWRGGVIRRPRFLKWKSVIQQHRQLCRTIGDSSLTSGDDLLSDSVVFDHSSCVRAFADSIRGVELLFIPAHSTRFSFIQGVCSTVKRNNRSTGRIAEAFRTWRHTVAHIVSLPQALTPPERFSPKPLKECVHFQEIKRRPRTHTSDGLGGDKPAVRFVDRKVQCAARTAHVTEGTSSSNPYTGEFPQPQLKQGILRAETSMPRSISGDVRC